MTTAKDRLVKTNPHWSRFWMQPPRISDIVTMGKQVAEAVTVLDNDSIASAEENLGDWCAELDLEDGDAYEAFEAMYAYLRKKFGDEAANENCI